MIRTDTRNSVAVIRTDTRNSEATDTQRRHQQVLPFKRSWKEMSVMLRRAFS